MSESIKNKSEIKVYIKCIESERIFIKLRLTVCVLYSGVCLIDKLYRSEYPHLVLVNPTISPKSLKHFLQRRRSYLRMRPAWHLHLLHSRLSLPNLRGWVLQRRLGISGKIKYYYLYKIQH